MRELKFRAWAKYENSNPHMTYMMDGKQGGRLIDLTSDDNWMVMQYTGLKDKNDIDIYEGDIVRRYGGGLLGDPSEALFTGEVVFTQHGYKAKYTQPQPGTAGHIIEAAYGNLFNESELEVIGNIYENPELLEAES